MILKKVYISRGGAQKAKSVGEAQLTLDRQADRTEDKTEDRTEDTACLCKFFHGEVCMFHCVLYQPHYPPERSSSIGKL